MDFPPPRSAPVGTDLRLHPFLEATSTDRADLELARLMEAATTMIVRVVRARSRGANPEVEDVSSEARSLVVARLQRLRSEGGAAMENSTPVGDFEAYVCTVAYNTCAEMMRRRDLGRAKQQNRLRYLLEKRTTQHGFALWNGVGNDHWAGFESWRDQTPETFSDAKRLQMLTNPRAAATAAFGTGGWSSLDLPELVSGLFVWLGGPLTLSDLTDAVVVLQGDSSPLSILPKDDAGHEPAEGDTVDPRSSPADELRWKEYLTWLWQQTTQLTLPQRSAFLLHSHCLHEMELAGLTSVRQTAGALGLAAERMAGLWNALPLDDLAIGALLGVGRQQVINWRKAARIQLGRAWHQWLNG